MINISTFLEISHFYLNRDVIQKGEVKKITPKSMRQKSSDYCLPILNYCLVIHKIILMSELKDMTQSSINTINEL
jgi:hypothetical protein